MYSFALFPYLQLYYKTPEASTERQVGKQSCNVIGLGELCEEGWRMARFWQRYIGPETWFPRRRHYQCIIILHSWEIQTHSQILYLHIHACGVRNMPFTQKFPPIPLLDEGESL